MKPDDLLFDLPPDSRPSLSSLRLHALTARANLMEPLMEMERQAWGDDADSDQVEEWIGMMETRRISARQLTVEAFGGDDIEEMDADANFCRILRLADAYSAAYRAVQAAEAEAMKQRKGD